MTGFSILVNAKEKIFGNSGATHHMNHKRHMHQKTNVLCTLLQLRKKKVTVPPIPILNNISMCVTKEPYTTRFTYVNQLKERNKETDPNIRLKLIVLKYLNKVY